MSHVRGENGSHGISLFCFIITERSWWIKNQDKNAGRSDGNHTKTKRGKQQYLDGG